MATNKMKVTVVLEMPLAAMKRQKSIQRKIYKQLGWSFVSWKVSEPRRVVENGKIVEETVVLTMVFTKKFKEE